MKLLRIGAPGTERPVVLARDGVGFDASTVAHDFDQEFFAGDGINRLRAAVERGDLPEVPTAGVRIGAPIAKPYQVLCVGMNYSDHIAEVKLGVPTEPTLFNKGPRTVIGPDDDVLLPPDSETTDWEVELAVVIGSEARYLPDEAAAEVCIAGYAISNDISERAFQLERGGQWVKGKSCETFNPLGPWLVTPDEVGDPQQLALALSVNGETKQRSSTANMIFSVRYLVWYISQFMVLEPGDLINTGTPAGVGLGKDPHVYLKEGDVMDLAIEGLGRQRQVTRRAMR